MFTLPCAADGEQGAAVYRVYLHIAQTLRGHEAFDFAARERLLMSEWPTAPEYLSDEIIE